MGIRSVAASHWPSCDSFIGLVVTGASGNPPVGWETSTGSSMAWEAVRPGGRVCLLLESGVVCVRAPPAGLPLCICVCVCRIRNRHYDANVCVRARAQNQK